jgi:hypothetical protein
MKPRPIVCLIFAMAALGVVPALAGASESCGKYRSTSVYDKAKVIAVEGVGCKEARRVAKRFDQDSDELAGWNCSLAHGDKRRLFSCTDGEGGRLKARGVGKRSD